MSAGEAAGAPARARRPPDDASLARPLRALLALRVVVVTTLLVTAFLVQWVTQSFSSALNPIYYLVGATYVLTLAYLAVYVWGRWRRGFAYVQLLGDLVIITGLIYYSGGIDSAFPFLYIITIITASILLMRRGGILTALVACVLYGTLVALIYNGVVPWPKGFLALPGTLSMNQVYYNLFVRWIGFLAAALLSSYLAEKVRETGETLEERSADLAKLRVFYEDVINSVNSGLVATDLGGRIGSVNHAAERILGQPFSELRERPVQAVLGVGEELLREVREGERRELSYTTPSGERRWLGVSVAPLFDRASEQRGFTLVVQDLTVLKDLEREVRMKERMAAIGEMAAGIAHEIRNPLASMSGSVQVLKADLPLSGEQRSLMDIVLRESERLNRIIEEFLYYTKPAPPLPQRVDLGELVRQGVALFRNSSEVSAEHAVEFAVGPGDLAIEADPDQLRQVLWNLLRNSVQAMPQGGRLRVEARAGEGDGVRLVVEDEGPGFDNERVERMWEPFHGSTTKGSGLGLALVYRIVRDHAGRVAIENRAPRGARISVWLPRRWSGESVLERGERSATAGARS